MPKFRGGVPIDTKTRALSRIVLFLLVLTLLGYAGLYLYIRLHETPETAVAEVASLRETVNIAGVFVRDETLLSSRRSYSSITADSGIRVAAGDVLGVSYDSRESLRRASKLLRLEKEIGVLSEALREAESADAAGTESAALAASRSLAEDIARHDTETMTLDGLLVRLRVMSNGAERVREELHTMESERERLLSLTTGEGETLTSPVAGIFSAHVDGYEKITPAALQDIGVSSLATLLNSAGDVDARCYGKIVPSFSWYLAATADAASVPALRVGAEYTLDLSRYGVGLTSAALRSISGEEDGRCVLVFYSDRSLTDTLPLRNVSCPIVLNTVTGLRVPASAIREDEKGAFVLLNEGSIAVRADIGVLREEAEEGYALIDGELLRAGSVVLLGKNIREGQLLR